MARKLINLVGQKFSRLTVVDRDGLKWRCLCDCGGSVVTSGQYLREGRTKSCGCLYKERSINKKLRIKSLPKHGLWHHPLYDIWTSMKYRCYNSKCTSYPNYGGRGIKVFDGWLNSPTEFISWIEENLGPRPEDHSLDRINNNEGYKPGNLRWADNFIQAGNRRMPRPRIHPRRRPTFVKKKSNLPIGVVFHKNRYMAKISITGKVKYLGSFTTAEEASQAYQKAVAENTKQLPDMSGFVVRKT